MKCAPGSASLSSAPAMTNASESEPEGAAGIVDESMAEVGGNNSSEAAESDLASWPQCKQEQEICGGPGLQTQHCCGDMACKNVVVGEETLSEMRCQEQCKQVGEVCGGPGQETLRCCGGMGCMQLFGRPEMTCAPGSASLSASLALTNVSEVEPKTVAGAIDESLVDGGRNSSEEAAGSDQATLPQCKQEQEICGGPGLQTQHCCGGMACKNVVVGEETLSEMRCQEQCKQVGEVCGGPGQETLR